MDRHNRRTAPVAGAEAGRETGYPALDREPALLQEVRHKFCGLELLHAELAEIKDAVAEKRDSSRIAVDVIEQEFLLRRDVGLHDSSA